MELAASILRGMALPVVVEARDLMRRALHEDNEHTYVRVKMSRSWADMVRNRELGIGYNELLVVMSHASACAKTRSEAELVNQSHVYFPKEWVQNGEAHIAFGVGDAYDIGAAILLRCAFRALAQSNICTRVYAASTGCLAATVFLLPQISLSKAVSALLSRELSDVPISLDAHVLHSIETLCDVAARTRKPTKTESVKESADSNPDDQYGEAGVIAQLAQLRNITTELGASNVLYTELGPPRSVKELLLHTRVSITRIMETQTLRGKLYIDGSFSAYCVPANMGALNRVFFSVLNCWTPTDVHVEHQHALGDVLSGVTDALICLNAPYSSTLSRRGSRCVFIRNERTLRAVVDTFTSIWLTPFRVVTRGYKALSTDR